MTTDVRSGKRATMTEIGRTVRTCADLIVEALREARSLSRHDLVSRGLVTASEAERGLRWLREAGQIRRCALSDGCEARVVRYELANPATAKSGAAAKRITPCFAALLVAWRMDLPPTVQQPWPVRYVNDAFAREEQLELAELQHAARALPARRGRQKV